jgi:hypothetical protein
MIAVEQRTAPPTACPRCGEPLLTGTDGVLGCRFDGWKDTSLHRAAPPDTQTSDQGWT